MLKKRKYVHPFLYFIGTELPSKDARLSVNRKEVYANRHHLFPRSRKDIPKKEKEGFVLRLWEYKHASGWNQLFQFRYFENNQIKYFELTIDEIITLMAAKHPFIVEKVGTKPWKILFKDKTLKQASELLCRMLEWKLDRQWRKIFPKKIDFYYKKRA